MGATFLDFIEADARRHPQRVRAIPVDVIDRARPTRGVGGAIRFCHPSPMRQNALTF